MRKMADEYALARWELCKPFSRGVGESKTRPCGSVRPRERKKESGDGIAICGAGGAGVGASERASVE